MSVTVSEESPIKGGSKPISAVLLAKWLLHSFSVGQDVSASRDFLRDFLGGRDRRAASADVFFGRHKQGRLIFRAKS